MSCPCILSTGSKKGLPCGRPSKFGVHCGLHKSFNTNAPAPAPAAPRVHAHPPADAAARAATPPALPPGTRGLLIAGFTSELISRNKHNEEFGARLMPPDFIREEAVRLADMSMEDVDNQQTIREDPDISRWEDDFYREVIHEFSSVDVDYPLGDYDEGDLI